MILVGKGFIGFLNLNNYEVERNAYHYWVLNAPILFFVFFNMMYTRILGSFGNNKLAFKINAVGVVVNIIIDPIFIYFFKLGVIGAGLATLIANIIMFILFKINSNGILKYDFKISIDYIKIKEIVKLGFPMAFKPFGINGIWLSISLSSILKGIFAYLLYEIKVGKKYVEAIE